jgi:hypothetical protein
VTCLFEDGEQKKVFGLVWVDSFFFFFSIMNLIVKIIVSSSKQINKINMGGLSQLKELFL